MPRAASVGPKACLTTAERGVAGTEEVALATDQRVHEMAAAAVASYHEDRLRAAADEAD